MISLVRIAIGGIVCSMVRSFHVGRRFNRFKALRVDNSDILNQFDKQIEEAANKIKRLKYQKNNFLSNLHKTGNKQNRGLKLFNETEINGQNFRKYAELYDNDDEEALNAASVAQLETDFSTFPFGIRVILPSMEAKPRQRDRKKGAAPKSEHFAVIEPTMHYNFTAIGGYDSVKRELLQCADMLLNPDKYKPFSVEVPKGIILEGPPGNGKTHLTRCFAGETHLPYISVSGSQFQEMYVGVGSSRVRELFKLARENTPIIVFIDEIDAIGRKRSQAEHGDNNSERDSTLNQLLVEMDGLEQTNGIFVIGATNRADLLDEALTRPGRIDKTIYVGLPDKKTREMILNIYKQNKPLNANITMLELIEKSKGMSGAQIKNWLNLATIRAIIRSNVSTEVITERDDLELVSDQIMLGAQCFENVYSESSLYQFSIHEMGHALVGLMLTDYNKLVKVSLNTWSPKSPGFTLFEVEEEQPLQSKSRLINHLTVLLAGRVAEEEFFPEHISTGASHDLETAKKVTLEMITKYGMGTRAIYAAASENSKEEIENEMNFLIDLAFVKARFIVTQARPLIEEAAKHLMKEKTVSPDWLIELINQKYSYLIEFKKNEFK